MPAKVGSDALDEILLEVRSLKKAMSGKDITRRPRFPFPCKNGRLCPYHACTSCWFIHDDDASPKVGRSTKSCDLDSGKRPQGSNTDRSSQLEAKFGKTISEVQATMEKKFTDFSSYVDRHIAGIESKLEALAEAVVKNEDELEDSVIEVRVDRRIDEKLSPFMKVAAVDEKLDEFMRNGVKDVFEAAMSTFAKHVGARIQTIEDRIGIAEVT